MAVMASPRARPTVARARVSASSVLARMAMLRCRPSMPSMCLYSDGWRTPRRPARAARVTFDRPTSSAICSASSTTRAWLSPALGTVVHRSNQVEDGGGLVFGVGRAGAMTAAAGQVVPCRAPARPVGPVSSMSSAHPPSWTVEMVGAPEA